MPEIYFRKIRTRGVYVNYESFRRVVRNEFQNQIGPDLIKLHDLTTADWTKRPEFKTTMKLSERGMSVSVFPDPENSASLIWNSLNKGVPGRVLRPNPARRRIRIEARKRRLGRSYRRNTRVIGRLRRPMALRFRGRGGEWVFRHEIPWPGIAAKKYSARIAKSYRPIFYRRVENAMKRGVRAAQREGS